MKVIPNFLRKKKPFNRRKKQVKSADNYPITSPIYIRAKKGKLVLARGPERKDVFVKTSKDHYKLADKPGWPKGIAWKKPGTTSSADTRKKPHKYKQT